MLRQTVVDIVPTWESHGFEPVVVDMIGDQFANTRMCKFFPMGKCTKGVQCPFAHDVFQLREQPDLRCTKMCRTMLKTGQCKDETCPYAHRKQDLRSTTVQNPKTTKLCRNLKFGVCSYGSKCTYAHSPAEINLPGMEAIPQLPPGLDFEGMFGDDDEKTSYVSDSNTDSGDTDSTPTPGNGLGEPAYVNIGSTIDLGKFCNQIAMDSFTKLPLEDSSFYSLGDFTGVTPPSPFWGMDPLNDYMNSAEFWHMDPMGEYHEQVHGWDWQGFGQLSVVD